MSRKAAREFVVHLLFSHDYLGTDADELLRARMDEDAFASLAPHSELYAQMPAEAQTEYIGRAVDGVIAHLPELDAYVEKYAIGWNVGRISRICKTILRLSMYETLYMHIPVGASVNEAVELSKLYDSEEAAAFVNGVLGSFVKAEIKERL